MRPYSTALILCLLLCGCGRQASWPVNSIDAKVPIYVNDKELRAIAFAPGIRGAYFPEQRKILVVVNVPLDEEEAGFVRRFSYEYTSVLLHEFCHLVDEHAAAGHPRPWLKALEDVAPEAITHHYWKDEP